MPGLAVVPLDSPASTPSTATSRWDAIMAASNSPSRSPCSSKRVQEAEVAPALSVWRTSLRHTGHLLRLALLLTALVTPLILTTGAVFDTALDTLERIGGLAEARFPTDEFLDSDVMLTRSAAAFAQQVLELACAAVTITAMLSNMRRPVGRRMGVFMAVTAVMSPALSEGLWLAQADVLLVRLVTVVSFVAVASVWSCLTAAAHGGGSRLGWLAFVLLLATVVQVLGMNWAGVVWFVSPDTSELERLVWLGLGQGLLMETFCLPTRWLAAEYPGTCAETAMGPVWHAFVFARLVERVLLSLMSTDAGVLAGVVVIVLRDVVLRTTVKQRDRLWIGWVHNPRDRLRERQQRQALRSIDETCDLFGMMVAAVFVLALRLSPERAAPPAWRVLGAAATQILCEIASAAAVLHGARTLKSRGVKAGYVYESQLQERATSVRQWGRAMWAMAVGMTIGATAAFLQIMADTGEGDSSVLCGWSHSGGWGWHRVPCALSERWSGS